jgi:hypothetical protein
LETVVAEEVDWELTQTFAIGNARKVQRTKQSSAGNYDLGGAVCGTEATSADDCKDVDLRNAKDQVAAIFTIDDEDEDDDDDIEEAGEEEEAAAKQAHTLVSRPRRFMQGASQSPNSMLHWDTDRKGEGYLDTSTALQGIHGEVEVI